MLRYITHIQQVHVMICVGVRVCGGHRQYMYSCMLTRIRPTVCMCGGVPAGYNLNALVDFPADDHIEQQHYIFQQSGFM